MFKKSLAIGVSLCMALIPVYATAAAPYVSGSLSPRASFKLDFSGARKDSNAWTLGLNMSAPQLDHSWNAAAPRSVSMLTFSMDHAANASFILLGQPLQPQPGASQLNGWGVFGYTMLAVGVVVTAVVLSDAHKEVHDDDGPNVEINGCNGVQVTSICVPTP